MVALVLIFKSFMCPFIRIWHNYEGTYNVHRLLSIYIMWHLWTTKNAEVNAYSVYSIALFDGGDGLMKTFEMKRFEKEKEKKHTHTHEFERHEAFISNMLFTSLINFNCKRFIPFYGWVVDGALRMRLSFQTLIFLFRIQFWNSRFW